MIDVKDRIVTSFYPEVRIDEADTLRGRRYFHSREYVSDFIANSYAGPAFYDIAHELLYEYNIWTGGTHPSYDSRLDFLTTNLPNINKGKSILGAANHSYRQIPDIDRIIKKAKRKISQVNGQYKTDDNDAKLALSDLRTSSRILEMHGL